MLARYPGRNQASEDRSEDPADDQLNEECMRRRIEERSTRMEAVSQLESCRVKFDTR
jgi:hypothetical protein